MSAARNRVERHASELTPEARRDRAKRKLAEAIDELLEAKLACIGAANDWVDQKNSPLGRRKHLRLVKLGKLRARKDGRQVLVRRVDVNAYIEKEGLARGGVREEDEEVDDILDGWTGGRKS